MHRTPLVRSRAATVLTSASRSPATNCRKNVCRAASSAGRPRPSGRCTAARRSAQPASTTARLAHACNKTVDRTSCGVGSAPRPRAVSNTIAQTRSAVLAPANLARSIDNLEERVIQPSQRVGGQNIPN